MENIELFYNGIDNEKYNQILHIIRKDFEKILEYRVKQYDNNEELINEMENVIDNITNQRFYDNRYRNFIELKGDYLSFDYPKLNKDNDYYEFITVIVSRDYKNFYFVHPKNDVYFVINKFIIDNNAIKKHEIIKHDLYLENILNLVKKLQI